MAHYTIGQLGLVALLLLNACAPRRLPVGTISCANASAQLRESWNSLQETRSSPGGCSGEAATRCDQLRLEIERLGQNCPAGDQTLLANAILAYDERQLPKAQQYLDTLLATQRPNAEAAALRARVAIEEGNLPFALRFLKEQIRLIGDHAGLREVHASALFLAADYPQANQELIVAERLGAPLWRVEYGKGLIAEALKNYPEARLHFNAAAKVRPEWPLPAARLRAIGAQFQNK